MINNFYLVYKSDKFLSKLAIFSTYFSKFVRNFFMNFVKKCAVWTGLYQSPWDKNVSKGKTFYHHIHLLTTIRLDKYRKNGYKEYLFQIVTKKRTFC